MTHRGWLFGVLMLLLSASLAGCLGDDDDAEPSTGDGDENNDAMDGDGDAMDGDGNGDAMDGDGDAADGDGNVTTLAPAAAFETGTGNTSFAPEETITFDASTTSDDDTNVSELVFSWDFGDGNTGEGINATHAFAEAGNFTVLLNVTDPEGNSDEANLTLTIELGFVDTVIEEFTGTITLPNPVIHAIGVVFDQDTEPVCSSDLDCFSLFGGVADTHYVIHSFEVPEGAAAVRIEAPGITQTASLQFAVFDGAGDRIVNAPVGTGGNPQAATLDDPAEWAGGVSIFVSSPVVPNSAYAINVIALAEVP